MNKQFDLIVIGAGIAGAAAAHKCAAQGWEVAIVDWLSSSPDVRAVRRLVRSCGDYAVALGMPTLHGFVPVPRQGPVITWRTLACAQVPRLDEISFSLGDIELF